MTGPPEVHQVALAWLDYATGDLAAARGGVQLTAIPGWIIGFHAQQAAEKAFKGALAARGVQPPRTHDLVRLDGLAQQAGLRSPLSGEELVALARFAVEDRYPVLDAPKVSRDVAASLVPLAERVVAWCERSVAQPDCGPAGGLEIAGAEAGADEIERIRQLVAESLPHLTDGLRIWAEAHLVPPRTIRLYLDSRDLQATFWLVTDHVDQSDSSYRIVFDPAEGMFGLEVTWQGGRQELLGLYGTFAETIINM